MSTKYVCLLLSLLFVAKIVAQSSSEAPENVDPYVDNCTTTTACFEGKLYYFEGEIHRNFDSAFQFCSGIGMSLVSVETCAENTFIMETIKNIGCGWQIFWTSGRQDGDKNWYWNSTGQPFTFTNWKIGEPNYLPDEFCVDYGYDYIQWNDNNCNRNRFFVCESQLPCPKCDEVY